jgi:hypothetical protein
MRQLRLPGQTRVHFYRERESRKAAIVTAICKTNVVVDLYDASSLGDERLARAACLRQLVDHVVTCGAEKLFIERDDSLVASDRALLYDAIRKAGATGSLRYTHLRPSEEPLLWIPDAVAWCWTHKHWRHRIRPIVRNVWKV